MEPLPESHSLEQFRASPIPRLRLQEPSPYYNSSELGGLGSKPPTLRRSTEPTPSSPSPAPASPTLSPASLTYRPRNTSPYTRGHIRSRSALAAPQMSRAQSLPGLNGPLLISTPQRRPSPIHSSPVRTPRKPADDVFPGLPNHSLSNIGEAADDDTPKGLRSASPTLGLHQAASYYRRPASPLRFNSHTPHSPTTPSSLASSPSFQNTKFHDSYLSTSNPGSFNYFGSTSVPSTPTSARSRSPSISSLETIPDSPDAEEAALEAERIAQLKADADAADGGDERKPKLEFTGSRGRTLGTGFGSRDKRKRWSVCGAERRGDLNLDTIWED